MADSSALDGGNTRVTALILADGPGPVPEHSGDGTDRLTFCGLTLLERAALIAQRAGIHHVHVVADQMPDDRVVERRRRRGLGVT